MSGAGCLMLLTLTAVIAASNAMAQRNPGYACSGSLDPAAELTCSDDDLAKASLELSQAYYALRGSVDQSLWQGYKQKAVEFLKAALRRCDVPSKGSVLAERINATKACLLKDIHQQRAYWLDELRRLNKLEGLQEAMRSADDNIALQQALKDQGWLPADAEIDGVFGEGTRQAVRKMQTAKGIAVTGLLSENTKAALSPSSGSVSRAQSRLPPCPTDQNAYWTNCFGTFTFPDGAKYVGEWKDDKRSGQGTFTFPDGAKYVGEFKDGKWNGQGTLFASSGRVVDNGIWRDDKFVTPNNLPNPVLSAQNSGGGQRPATSQTQPSTSGSSVMLIKEGGTYKVPVRINGVLDLHFTVDSGASDVSIPIDVVMTLIRTGTIRDGDFVGEQTYRLADGSTIKSKTFRIRELKVGDRTINNVLGSVADIKGSLLLGQSFLSRFKRVSFDYSQGVLVLE